MQAVNQRAHNPGILYEYTPPTTKPDESLKTPTPHHVDVPSLPSTPAAFLEKPKNMQISMSHVPQRRYGITNVRILPPGSKSGDRSRMVDTVPANVISVHDRDSNIESKFVYTNGVQVLGGENSIRDNKLSLTQEKNNLGNDLLELRARAERRDSDTPTVLESHLSTSGDHGGRGSYYGAAVEANRENRDNPGYYDNERFQWSTGRWAPCSANCGQGNSYTHYTCTLID